MENHASFHAVLAEVCNVLHRAEQVLEHVMDNKRNTHHHRHHHERSVGRQAAPLRPRLDFSHQIRPDIMSYLKEARTKMNVEVEARLGTWNVAKRQFVPGVSRYFMEKSLSLLESYAGWCEVLPWEEYQDFFFRDQRGELVRSSVQYVLQPKSAIAVRHVFKKKFDNVDILVPGEEHPDIRVSVAVEEELDSQQSDSLVPEIVQPEFVRIKQRKSFRYAPRDFETAIWAYDVTLTWSGCTRSEAESRQASEPPTYEIECECMYPLLYRCSLNQDLAFVARSMLMKLLDLSFPPTSPPSEPSAASMLACLELPKIEQ